MPLETTARIVKELTRRGYNVDREAVTLLAGADDPDRAIERAVETAPTDTLVLTADHVRETLESSSESRAPSTTHEGTQPTDTSANSSADNPPVSPGEPAPQSHDVRQTSPAETKGSGHPRTDPPTASGGGTMTVSGDILSTGTGEYGDFVSVFRDRYEQLAGKLRGRVNHRPTDAIADMTDGSEVGIIGMVADIHTTTGGHWRLQLEDTNGTFPCLILKDRDFADEARELLCDEAVAVEGTVANDGGSDPILFVDNLYFPDVPRTYKPSTADRHVQAALISDVHVGSEEFQEDAWNRFADWLHTDEAAAVEYLLIGGDMVEGVGVYPNQDEELDIVDIYDQYERFSEHLKAVPGDLDIVMIPGNHDAVRLAEPQPAFDEELRDLMSAHDPTISANPSTVTIEGVSVLMYHGVSLDEVIAELPDDRASYDRPHDAMARLLRKRHLAPQYGGMTRIAPEEADHLIIDEVPDIFHAGHVHKLGYGTYHNVLTINSSCWQAQTDFQQSVNLDPDVGYAPIVSLDTLELEIRQFT